MKPSLLGPTLLTLGSMISVTAGASLAKTLFATAGASGVTVVRIGFGTLLLCLFWRPWQFSLNRSQLKSIIYYGICLGPMNLLFYNAILRLPIALAIAIEFLGPLTIALWFSKQWLDGLWAMLAVMGIVLILPLSSFAQPIDPLGVIYALAAAAFWAGYIVLGKRAGAQAHPGAVTSLGMLTGFLAIVPFGVSSAPILFSSYGLIGLGLAVGLLSSAIPYSFEMLALRSLPEKYFSLLMSLEPAVAAIIAFVFLGETLTSNQLAAIACVVGASVGSSYSHRVTTIEPTPQ